MKCKADPDYLFMIVHGTEEYGKQKLKEDLESNPAWSSLRAVKEKRMVFLPSDFVNSPGLKIDQTFEYRCPMQARHERKLARTGGRA
ncbi:ABC transporter substrate-binding protein [Cohnella nanjingensis]|uniref:ABC transporter substrate-binding protein n=1 Tax=Cohnella nanjingensis TaxID=1387779 RepID=A0A7X0RUM4_9BACL|nr:ABC transporter substrate-binding protein [Cohnella nanjingensis]MBB6674012.1 ABC transporter substrate-binding protein [Cohnella nanjingensis]